MGLVSSFFTSRYSCEHPWDVVSEKSSVSDEIPFRNLLSECPNPRGVNLSV